METSKEFRLGRSYKTVGGWEARIVYISNNLVEHPMPGRVVKASVMYVVHQPNSPKESLPILHDYLGKVYGGYFEIGSPPLYGQPHPADLTYELWSDGSNRPDGHYESATGLEFKE